MRKKQRGGEREGELEGGCEDGGEEEGRGGGKGEEEEGEREREEEGGREKGRKERECMYLFLSQPQMRGLLWLKVGEVPSGRCQVSQRCGCTYCCIPCMDKHHHLHTEKNSTITLPTDSRKSMCSYQL